MGIEGFWALHFLSDQDENYEGRGVAHFQNGSILGGDNGFYYIGEYRLLDDSMPEAQIKIVKHEEASQGVLGQDSSYVLYLSGTFKGEGTTFMVVGTVNGDPFNSVVVRLSNHCKESNFEELEATA